MSGDTFVISGLRERRSAASPGALSICAGRWSSCKPKLADVTYDGLAELAKLGLKGETVDSIKAKLKRGTFAATFLVAVVAALEMEAVRLEDL